MTGSAMIVVNVLDTNNHAPQFDNLYAIPVVGLRPGVGNVVARLKVIDLDSDENGPPFALSPVCDDEKGKTFCEAFSIISENGKQQRQE